MEEKERKQAIVFDIDGTLAHMTGRIERRGKKVAPFADWDAHDDDLDPQVSYFLKLVRNHDKDMSIVICSGRKDSSKDVLIKWLEDNDLGYDRIYMRKHGDNRPDFTVKKEIYENDIFPEFDVFLVVDDRDQVVNMVRNDLNLKCFQVAEGNF